MDGPGSGASTEPEATARGSWWSRVGPVKRVVVGLLGLVVGLNVMVAALDLVVGRDPGGPSGSSFSTGEDGVAAWADLLEARDVPVTRLRTPLGDAALEPGSTLVVVDPPEAPGQEALAAVAAHVEDGGRLVAVGREATDFVVAAVGLDPGWTATGPARLRVLTPTPATAGVEELVGDGRGSFTTPSGFVPLVGANGEVVAVQKGPVVAVADPTLLGNRHLADADNAAFALALAGQGPVVFAEALHGYGADQGLAAVPSSWLRAGGALIVAAVVAMWSAGQRLGPPERTARPLAPPRAAYLDAMVAALSRTPGGGPSPPGTDDTDRTHPYPPGGPHVR